MNSVSAAVHVERIRTTDLDDVEGARGKVVAVHRPRRHREPRCDDRDLVATARELCRLAVDVLGDPAELGVVVVADDSDPHVSEARNVVLTLT